MRLRVNRIDCVAHGLCAELLPEWIRLDERGYPILSDPDLPFERVEHARRATTTAQCSRCAWTQRTSERSPFERRSVKRRHEPEAATQIAAAPSYPRLLAPPPGALDRPGRGPAPYGMIAVTDDWHHRVILIDPQTNKVISQYGHGGHRKRPTTSMSPTDSSSSGSQAGAPDAERTHSMLFGPPYPALSQAYRPGGALLS